MPMDQIDPAIYDDLIGWGNQTAGIDPQIAQQQAMAQRLRAAGAAPQTRMSGRIASAPSKWEFLGALANQYGANQQDKSIAGLQAQQQAYRTMQTNRVLEALKAMRGMQQPQQPQQPMVPGSTPQAGV